MIFMGASCSMELQFPTFRRIMNSRLASPFTPLWPRYTTAAQRHALLRLLATATEERLPLIPLIEAWTEDERGVQKQRLKRLLTVLKQGASLPNAVEQVPGVLSDEDVLTIRFGAESGMLASAIRDSLDKPTLLSPATTTELRRAIAYLCVMIAVGLFAATFLQLKIVPAFEAIARDFSLETTPVLSQSQEIAEFVAQYWWLGAIAFFLALWLVFSVSPGRPIRRRLARSFFGPLQAWCESEVIQKLAMSSGTGRPIPGAVSTLARYHFDRSLRHKLLFVRNEMEQGADVWRSMEAVKLLTTPEVAALETAERLDNRAWVLKQLALVKKRRISRRLESMCVAVTPLLVLLVAVFVLYQALIVFLTITQLLTELA